ncbi:hypothetical protein [Paenibacillus polymyxa]|nr:hypothetical protein [Paenibacillus polymyxa]WPQ57156.1 hypothetical protein SKN87_01260 [Paenibacillus polymyxa]
MGNISDLVTVPDRFNDMFAERGWILYDMMSLATAEEAVKRAEDGDIEGAEQKLVEYYDAETTRLHLSMMQAIKAFRPRLRLAYRALTDYEEERYHACIPVVLALLDGLVNDIHQNRKGFFAEDIEFEAWDSLAAHSKGLGQLASIFRKGRRSTTTDPLTLPYRNGILHGTDLGYDNRLVAAKTWATLFSLRDWALKVENGKDKPPVEKPKESLRKVMSKYSETLKEHNELQKWKPREIILNDEFVFQEGSPEFVLNEFMELWKRKNYGYMSKLVQLNKVDDKQKPKKVKEKLADCLLKDFKFLSINDIAAATAIELSMQIEKNNIITEYQYAYSLINIDEENKFVRRGKPGSKWKIEKWNYQSAF